MKAFQTYDRIKREVENRYHNAKDKKSGTSLSSEEFKSLIRKVFADFQMTEIIEGSKEDGWYRSLVRLFGSHGGKKNSKKNKTQPKKIQKGSTKKKKEDPQSEFKLDA